MVVKKRISHTHQQLPYPGLHNQMQIGIQSVLLAWNYGPGLHSISAGSTGYEVLGVFQSHRL